MNKRKIIISIILGGLLLVLVILLINRVQDSKEPQRESEKVFIPEYLSSEEKQSLGIPEEANIQVINRNSDGEVSVYKIVESGAQAINPEEIAPISPRTSQTE